MLEVNLETLKLPLKLKIISRDWYR